MEKHTKTAHFSGGPIDGQTRHLESNQTLYKHEQPPRPEDIRLGEVPVGFFPPMHEYLYVEEPVGSGTFVFKEQHH
ncbi:hypothetical protein EXU57_05260 [Segetibacter sp. 3557_3]|uniref:hypothetical protein n=1 Tax=Segetibacter sp. 3557_3 TaxID=2547429 RepID=UPI001058A230|nr:hypothetical protein [Segetibacter sp. 3557_3]TDH27876.1 hypothetical protein EXU57_05260 [Segetibacter sp. 3557_3]